MAIRSRLEKMLTMVKEHAAQEIEHLNKIRAIDAKAGDWTKYLPEDVESLRTSYLELFARLRNYCRFHVDAVDQILDVVSVLPDDMGLGDEETGEEWKYGRSDDDNE